MAQGPVPRGAGPFLCPKSPFPRRFPAVCHIFAPRVTSPAGRVCHCGPSIGRPRSALARPDTATVAMNTALSKSLESSAYADCLEAIRARLAAREARLYGIAVMVVHVHQIESLYETAGPANAGRMLDELRNRLSQVSKPGDYFARLGDRKFAF